MSKKLSQTQKDTINALEEIWGDYEGEKLAHIEFLRGDYTYFDKNKKKERTKEADKTEMDLDSKRVFLKLAKRMIRKSGEMNE